MTIAEDKDGAARQWGVPPDCLEQEVWENVVRAWAMLHFPTNIRVEDPITRLLWDKLDELMVTSESTRWVVYDQKELWDQGGEIIGRTDLSIRHLSWRTQFYIVECKRLNIPADSQRKRADSNADNYVADGMTRFVTGQYSPEMPCGGMLGYVMDGDLPKARKAMESALDKHAPALVFPDKRRFGKCRFLPTSPQGGTTRHRRGRQRFVLHHLLVNVREQSAPR